MLRLVRKGSNSKQHRTLIEFLMVGIEMTVKGDFFFLRPTLVSC